MWLCAEMKPGMIILLVASSVVVALIPTGGAPAAKRCDPAVVADEHVADDRRGLSRIHGQEGGVRDEQAGAGERHKANRRSHERHQREQLSQKRRNTLRNTSHAHHSHSGAAHINARAGAWVGTAANGGVSRPRPRWRNNGIT